jgi:hypothetical protein
MNPNRTIPTNITIQLNEHCTDATIEESIALIYQCYIIECQRKGLRFVEPIMDALGQQSIPHQFKQALHKYLWVNDLYLSHLSEIKTTYLKIMNQ